jgi:MFS family permease
MRKLHYGWVIVAVCALMMGITYGLMYSYSVFFKPLAEYFNWDRATVSGVYSASLIFRGAVSIFIGWLADRFGATRLMAFCGLMIGLGLILSSQITQIWHLYLTYALVEAIGLSGTFGIATAVTSRWFTRNRGLALGIVSSGSGIGTLLIVPGSERLINATDWSMAFIISGAIAGVIMFSTAFLLRPAPDQSQNLKVKSLLEVQPNITMATAARNPNMMLLLVIFALVFFCNQIVNVHIVNYATDIGIAPLIAATFISVIGVVSIAGRLTMGVWSDRISIHNSLIICCAILVVSLVFLVFTEALWTFYLFAIIFGFCYGGEVPLIPLFISRFFGTRSMAGLMGLLIFVANIGGALGPWLSGRIFDSTGSYQLAFIITASAALVSLILALGLKRRSGDLRLKTQKVVLVKRRTG